MRNFVRSIVLLLALGLSEPVLAGPLEDADAAYRKQDYTTALRLFRPLANRGDAEAQFMLGSAKKSPHELALGRYSVHTSREALERGEAEISRVGKELKAKGVI